MPIYEFRCNNCNFTTELYLSVNNRDTHQPCPTCRMGMSRPLSTPTILRSEFKDNNSKENPIPLPDPVSEFLTTPISQEKRRGQAGKITLINNYAKNCGTGVRAPESVNLDAIGNTLDNCGIGFDIYSDKDV